VWQIKHWVSSYAWTKGGFPKTRIRLGMIRRQTDLRYFITGTSQFIFERGTFEDFYESRKSFILEANIKFAN
jgi:hypothetical protein